MDYSTLTYKYINSTYNNANFINIHRVSDADFTRKSPLSFPNFIEIFLNTSHHSIKAEMNDFFYKKSPQSEWHLLKKKYYKVDSSN